MLLLKFSHWFYLRSHCIVLKMEAINSFRWQVFVIRFSEMGNSLRSFRSARCVVCHYAQWKIKTTEKINRRVVSLSFLPALYWIAWNSASSTSIIMMWHHFRRLKRSQSVEMERKTALAPLETHQRQHTEILPLGSSDRRQMHTSNDKHATQ